MIFNINANHQSYVLTKTAALFSRFGLTIEDWQMSANKESTTMNQQIQVCCETEVAQRIQKQLQRMVDVYQVDFFQVSLADSLTEGGHWHLPNHLKRQQRLAAT